MDSPGGPGADGLELFRNGRPTTLKIGHRDLEPRQGDAVNVSVQKVMVGQLVVDDLLPIALDHPLRDRLQLPRQPAHDHPHHVLPDDTRPFGTCVRTVGAPTRHLRARRSAARHRRHLPNRTVDPVGCTKLTRQSSLPTARTHDEHDCHQRGCQERPRPDAAERALDVAAQEPGRRKRRDRRPPGRGAMTAEAMRSAVEDADVAIALPPTNGRPSRGDRPRQREN